MSAKNSTLSADERLELDVIFRAERDERLAWALKLMRLDGLADAAGRGTALIEIPVDRRQNVELHQRIAERVDDALGAHRGA